jgi:SAM-dependent methyltransferase
MANGAQQAAQLLRHLAITRIEGRSVRSLCEIDPGLWDVERPLLALMQRNPHALAEGIDSALGCDADDPVKLLTTQMIRLLHGRNQFIEIDEAASQQLASLYRGFVLAVRRLLSEAPEQTAMRAALANALRDYHAKLAAFILQLDPPGPVRGMIFREVRCAEYEPVLQLRVLGIDAESLLEPILDLGCGESAALVRHLIVAGKGAFGVDRAARGEPFIVGHDWLDYPIKEARWGTVISHLGLSNHFLHHHLRPAGLAERYARKYMEILRGLKPGGLFLYSPGLPFMETLLPRDAYSVLKKPIARMVGSVCDDEMRSVYGASVCYASHVLRLPG